MSACDLALVQCPGWGRECPPYSLACLAAYARREGFRVRCFDLNNAMYHASAELARMWEDKDFYSFWEDRGAVGRLAGANSALLDRFVDDILATGARVVGMSVHTTSQFMSLELARRIKAKDPARLVVFGGPQCSHAQAARPLAAEPCVDAVCTGEGEAVLMDILRAAAPVAPLPGLVVRTADGVKDGGPRPGIEDMDSLPLPDYSDFDADIRGRRYASPERLDVMDSRGCVRRCHFCSEWGFWGKFRSMSGERIFREVSEQVRRHQQVDRFYFIGSLLNGAPKELERFCDLMIASGLRVRWEGQAIVGPALDERLLEKMARAGCAWLGFGIESGSERLRRAMNKPFSDDEAFRALRAASRHGIRTQVNIMFGLPGETREDFAATLRFLVRCRPHIDSVLASQSFTVLDKRTELYEHPDRFGISGREHHLYWSSDGGANDYAERLRRYEEFCRLALSLGLPETSGVLRRKPDKWLLLGEFHRWHGRWAAAARCFGRSLRLEAVPDAARAGYEACTRILSERRKEPAALLRLEREASLRVNRSEFDERREVLSVPPRLVTLGTHNACNARCLFCPPGDFPRFDLALYKSFFEGRMGHFIRQAEKVTFTGFGEVLLHPDAPALLDYLNETIPETWKIFTTNGSALKPAVMERLLRSRFVVQVSLHAAKAALHEELTGLKGAFDPIVAAVRELCRLRRELDLGERLHLVLVDVVTTRNVDDLPDLLRLAWDLQVPELQCNYVTVYEPAHIPLTVFFEPDRANRAIDAAQAVFEELRRKASPEEFEHFQVRLPQKFGQPRQERDPKAVCREPWEHVYVECQGPVLPCCMWGEHVGNLARGDSLDEVFNGPVYRAIRSGMGSGKPHPWCANCANYRGWNVDSLLAHLTNRPETQKRLLQEIRARGMEVPA